jgi:hypothetical protein
LLAVVVSVEAAAASVSVLFASRKAVMSAVNLNVTIIT